MHPLQSVPKRRTKIVATIGPACEDPETIGAMVDAGMDVARINLAHGGLDLGLARYDRVREVARRRDARVGILVDLPGPKVRTRPFPDGGSLVFRNAIVRLATGDAPSSAEVINVEYPTLLDDLEAGDPVSFGDGQVMVRVVERARDHLVAEVVHGGRLQGRPGVSIPSEHAHLDTPTPEDHRLLAAFLERGVDMVAMSFVRTAADLHALGLPPHPSGPLLVAKIETKAAVTNLVEIIEASGAIMIARGDLGIDCPLEELPHIQKHIIQTCVRYGRPMITATQMLESMVSAGAPTRAEVSDVANAVLDGTSALMLSGETAVGHDPVLTVRTMARVAERADNEFDGRAWGEAVSGTGATRVRSDVDVITDTVTEAAWHAATELDAAAIICWSGSGHTVRAMARFRPRALLLGLSPNPRTVQQLTLSWGTIPIEVTDTSDEQGATERALAVALEAGYVSEGDTVVVVLGSASAGRRVSDTLRLLRVGANGSNPRQDD